MSGYPGLAIVLAIATLSVLCHCKSRRCHPRGKNARIPCSTSTHSAHVFVLISTVLLGSACALSNIPCLMRLHDLCWLCGTGHFVSLAGLALSAWSRMSLGVHYSPCFDSWLPGELVSTGPYRYLRHPQYAGNLLILIGLFLATGSLWIGDNVVLLFFYYESAARAEEQALTMRFAEYDRYRRATGRFLPRVAKS